MNKSRKADLCGIGSKTLFDGQSNQAFSSSNYKSELEPVQQILKRVLPGASMHAAIDCFDCKRNSELDGYRFTLVPLCKCCRTERELQIIRNRFERRQGR